MKQKPTAKPAPTRPVKPQSREGSNFMKAKKTSDWLYVIAAIAIIAAVVGFKRSEELYWVAYILYGVTALFILLGMQVYIRGCVCPWCGRVLPRQHGPFCEDCGKRLESYFEQQDEQTAGEKAPVWQPEKPVVTGEHATPKPVRKVQAPGRKKK